MEIAGIHIGKSEIKKTEVDPRVEMMARREEQISEFIETTIKINFKIAQLRYITYQSKTDQGTKEQAKFAAILLRRTERVFAKSQGISIKDESFNELGWKVVYDPEKYDVFNGEINKGDDVIVVQPALKGNYIPGYAPEIVHKAKVCSQGWFFESDFDGMIRALEGKSAEGLTGLWG